MATNVAKQIDAVRKSAEKMHAAATERIATASAGDVVRQGDLYLVCLKSSLPGKLLRTRQLAPGDTQGSRHVAEGDCKIVDPESKAAVSVAISHLVKGADVPQQLVGPIVECHGDTTIAHPEHGDRILPAGSTWGVIYQRAYAEEVRRVQD